MPINIIVETKGRVGIIRLNRPQVLNALNKALVAELNAAVAAFDADEGIGCMIITGSEQAFAAGADIGAMATYTFADGYHGDYITRNWETIRSVRKPVIAAVSGFALGGGCGRRLRARRRLRVRHAGRSDYRGRQRQVRPAGD